MKALRMSLESRLQKTFCNNHPLVAWMASFAAEALNVFRRDAGGKTAYEKEFSRRWTKPRKRMKTGLGARHGRTNSAMGLSEDPGVYSGWTHVCMGDGTVYSKARARFGLQADAVCDELHRECQDPGQGLP